VNKERRKPQKKEMKMTQKTAYGQLAEAIGAGESSIIPEIFKMLADEN